jgi:hypothetical protein
LFAVVYSGLALDLIRRTDSRRLASAVGVSASLFSSLALIFVVAFEQGALSAFVAIAGGVLMLVAGVALKHRTSSVAGVFTMIAGVLFGFDALQALILASDWIDLAIFGACAIATGSVLDRYGTVIRIRLANLGKSIGKPNDGQGGSVALDD